MSAADYLTIFLFLAALGDIWFWLQCADDSEPWRVALIPGSGYYLAFRNRARDRA